MNSASSVATERSPLSLRTLKRTQITRGKRGDDDFHGFGRHPCAGLKGTTDLPCRLRKELARPPRLLKELASLLCTTPTGIHVELQLLFLHDRRCAGLPMALTRTYSLVFIVRSHCLCTFCLRPYPLTHKSILSSYPRWVTTMGLLRLSATILKNFSDTMPRSS